MTTHVKIGAEAPRKEYAANGTQTAFPFDFAVFQAADVEIRLDGTVVTAGFTVSVAGDGRGTVTFAVAPAAGARVTLLRRLTIRRQTDFQEGGELRAKTLNDELDFQTASVQQVAHETSRAVRLPESDEAGLDMRLPVAAARAHKVLAFDAAGLPVASTLPFTAINPLPVAEGGTGATTAAGARTSLGVDAPGTAASLIVAHEAAADPHPGYLTAAEGAAAYQPLDADLSAIAALDASAGLIAKTGADTYARRSVAAGAGMSVANGNGAAGNPTVARAFIGFQATRTSDQTGVASATFTKIQFNVENFDTNGWYDPATNFRFTPLQAGYYRFRVGILFSGSVGIADQSVVILVVYKNGSSISEARAQTATSGRGAQYASVTCVLFMNGSTDYVEAFGFVAVSSGTGTFIGFQSVFEGEFLGA